MFGLFTNKNSEVDVLAKAKVRATREKNEDVAVRQFIETVRANDAVMSELRATSRKTVEYLCLKSGIVDESRRRNIHMQIERSWEQTLSQSAREFVRDCRSEAGSESGAVRGLVIEFATF